MDDRRRSSGHLMLITPERVLYAGLLGRPRGRMSGGFNIYVSIEGGLSFVSDGWTQTNADLIVVPPEVRHTITSDHRAVIVYVIEPESVARGVLDALLLRCEGPERAALARRIRAAHAHLHKTCGGQIATTACLDKLCLGETLPSRALDPRVARAIARMDAFGSGEPVTADVCAAGAGLSTSRFLHLFKEETGIAFRALRAWKRARHLLHYVNEDVNFARLAQDIGYPDSTHFSHSIRRYYGLKPRAIFSGSRDLAIYRTSQDGGLAISA